MNPARTLGPDLIGWTARADIWIYLLAPPLGAIVGWAAHLVVVRGGTEFRDDLARAATDLRGVDVATVRHGPGQVTPEAGAPDTTPPRSPGG